MNDSEQKELATKHSLAQLRNILFEKPGTIKDAF
jgi:hypothetical protein